MRNTYLTMPGPAAFAGDIASSAALGTFATIVLAVVATGLPIVAHLAGQTFGIAACFVLAGLVANYAAAAVPIVLIFGYLFQNLFVALVSPAIGDVDQFNAIRAYNFILTVATWSVIAGSYWLARARFEPRVRTVMNVSTLALIAIGLYFGVGLASNPSGAIIYLRNIAAPLLLFQVFLLVAQQHRVAITAALVLLATGALLFGYAELVGQDQLFRLINGDVYLLWRMKNEIDAGVWIRKMYETGIVYRSYLDALQSDFLNTPWLADVGIRLPRLGGPNFHPISYAYALAIFSLLLAAIGRWWFVLLALPLLLVIGSKGALVLVVLSTGALLVIGRRGGLAPLWCYAALLVGYAVTGIAVGLSAQDYHVIGFIGGLRGFLQNPLGHGIGNGGNLSLNMTTIDWSRSQNMGSTDVAVESAVGVLLYQMGMLAVALLALLITVVVILWRNYLRTRDRTPAALALGLLTITVNGIFQEEALFSPLALGLLLALCGTALGRGYRRVYQDPRLMLSRQDKAAISAPNSPGTSAPQHG
jgi:hypothetical protein